MRMTKRHLTQAVTALGGSVEDESDGKNVTLQCVAPDGFLWGNTDVHVYPVTWISGCTWSMEMADKAIRYFLDEIASKPLIPAPDDYEY